MSRLRIRVRDPSEPTPRTQNERLIEANFERLINNPKVIFGVDCDGQRCGLGRWIGGYSWLCPHNNLAAVRPDIAIQIHPSNKVLPEDIHPGSNKQFFFICNRHTECDGHIWKTAVVNRVTSGSGCILCSGNQGYTCRCNSLASKFPHLIQEWDERNELSPWEVTPGSQKKIWWRCSNHKTCDQHVWNTSVSNRVYGKTQCSFCSMGSNLVCPCDSFASKFPHLAIEWHEDNKRRPEQVKPGCDLMVKWRCSKHTTCDQHVWETMLYNRTRLNSSGCPFCEGSGGAFKICPCNNLEALFPDVAKEWHEDNPGHPSQYPPKSREIVKWRCSSNPSHVWTTMIGHRTSTGMTKCPHCCNSRSHSDKAMDWLLEMEEKLGIKIRHAKSPQGEFIVPGPGFKADGYCEETNTIFEYYGDFWHGNPHLFNPNDMNPKVKKTFGQLYEKTLKREERIRELGYNLVTRWETEFP